MSGRRSFSELKKPILDDPIRVQRFASARDEAEAEHRAFALDELRRRLGVSQDQLAAALVSVSRPCRSRSAKPRPSEQSADWSRVWIPSLSRGHGRSARRTRSTRRVARCMERRSDSGKRRSTSRDERPLNTRLPIVRVDRRDRCPQVVELIGLGS
jgi:hypothetical protein